MPDQDVLKAKTPEKVVEKKPETLEEKAISVSRNIALMCYDEVAMPQVKNNIHALINTKVPTMSLEDRKEFARLIREKVERLRQFMEAAQGEVIAVTSQQNW